MNLPDYLILGETKCGTTSLYNYLIKHPQIKDTYGNGDEVDESYATKEIRFFDRYFGKGIEWYKSCFPELNTNEITGEATPMYLYRTMALHRIHQHLPDAKFIVLLRNPIDRLFSNFQHYYKWVPNWSESYPDFETYINSCSDRDYFMIDKGLYAQTLRKWFHFFPRDQFFIESTENLNSSPQKVISKIYKFLGLKDFKLNSFNYFRKNTYQPMKQSTRKMLFKFYYPYNKDLFELLERDFGWNN